MKTNRRALRKLLNYRFTWVVVSIVVVAGSFLIGYIAGGSGVYSPENIPHTTPQEEEWERQGLLFYDGLYVVGSDIQPGIYRTTGRDVSVYGCRWQRLSGFRAETNNIIVHYYDDLGRPTIVEVADTDRGFKTEGCGKWYHQKAPINDNPRSFGDGAFLVGFDIQPGIYASPADARCYWERLSGVSRLFYHGRLFGQDSELIASSRNRIVEILPTDKVFISHQCQKWTPKQ